MLKLVEAENDMWYDIAKGYGFAVAFSIERGIFMARKSRKHQYTEGLKYPVPVTVGYIRLSVANKAV